ncbi:MAG: outer membrane lipoprotein chaperone LolA [Cobetia sp.]|jgi:outer membrane lipoprotein carrier protein|uniref:Outer-membrane lipoprotein carrier protein n=2 Tax=Cobetia TaxID=204286 RepID=A0AAP4WWG4_9GAMM|nr:MULTISPECIES: outer membrane lipoprotein chaperone LolA [Cobetia]AVV34779.1 outer membrane lipoprotein chaperone LolA [Halomonas sp. SF2003]MBR9798919.1 outer membrane lipoprotein chaperone LolA [Gammaproteobacteria bacterium]UTV86225.1 outer membrane lipoprotein chaperone LolA [Cobetia litoralis]KPM81031.1 outer membrane lipoprotein carrier protein LolA [Cobetia sp. UCD-24C]MBE2166971.1 outer membrane lipoprotein chaperone LolA [Cobetia sp. 2AS1]|tara:strand:- start:37886 stop:38554 length:669 start_codon:yes stop_codon:yes gene_type:complete
MKTLSRSFASSLTARLAKGLGAALMLGMAALPAHAEESAGDRLSRLLEPLKTYAADFDQQILDASGQRLQEAKGKMWLSRPGKFRWSVDAPYRQEVVSDGKEVYLHDPDLEQVTVQPLDERVTHTPALLLSGRASELTANYAVKRQQQGARETFTLTPKQADTLFESLKLTFDSEQLDMLQMADSTGQRTAIDFSNVQYNPSLQDSRFVFQIPQGADVIREQ